MFVGGLVGLNGDRKEVPNVNNKITDSYSNAIIEISSDKQFELYAGQLLGAAYATVSDCAAYGSLTVTCTDTTSTKSDPNKVYLGGFAGDLGVKAERIYAKANISAEGTGNVSAAGIAGIISYNNAGGTGRGVSSYVSGAIVINTKSASTTNNYASALTGNIYVVTKNNACLDKAYYGSLTLVATCNNIASTPKDNGTAAAKTDYSLFFSTIGFDSNLWSYANGTIKLKIEG